jgi:putative aga operon transcriptional repressor
MNFDRREKIRDMLRNKPFVSLHELEEMFPDVSSMTLRRDIDYFEKQSEAIKVRGGARSMKFITSCMEGKFSLRMNEHPQEKQKIADVAIKMIETERSVFLDSGTTIFQLASMMPDERLVITTTGPNIALELIKKKLPIVNLVGGMLNRDSISVSGNVAVKYLSDINIDVAFIVPSGVSSDNGFTCGNYSECEFKRLVIEKARRTVILTDNSKLDKTLPYTFADFSMIDTIITDRVVPQEIADEARKSGTKIIVADLGV